MAKSKTQQSLLFGSEKPPEVAPPAADAPAETTVQPQPERPAGIAGLKDADVWIIDSHSLIFQVFHALPPMTSPTGQPVSAVFGFARDVALLLREKKPDYLICAFDPPGGTFRHDLYDNYKETREEMPVDLRPQIGLIRRMLEAMNVAVLEKQNYEADDVLATVAAIVEEQGGQCTLVTSDKDCRQLISDNVRMYNVRKNAFYDAEALMADWGVRPDQVVDFQSLVGDSVDNVPGVPLIGPKIAKELLETYGTLDAVLDNAGEVKGAKRRENLQNGREMAELSRDLVRLVRDVPIEVDWDACRVQPINQDEVQSLCREYGFRTLARDMAELQVNAAPAEQAVWNSNYQTIDTAEKLDALVEHLQQVKRLSFDTETTSTSPRWADLVGISLAWDVGEGAYIPIRAPEGDVQLDEAVVLEKLRDVLENPAIEKVGQNLKYDLVVLRGVGVNVRGTAFDTMVAHYLLEAGARSHSLDELSQRYLQHKTVKISELIGTGKNQITMDQVPVEKIAYYAAEDADIPLRLDPILSERIESESLSSLLTEVELPLIDVLVEMEYNGVRVDVARLNELSRQYGERMEVLEREIYRLAGREFNIASPKQLSTILFEELDLPVIKKTKTGASTDAEVLEQLAKQHDMPAKIVQFRQYAKLKGTYVDALPTLVCPKTNRVHTSFNQVVAATGRLSSNEPNLQNIPIRTQESREIRSAFVPGESGWKLLCADYSQIELRVLAHFSGDPALMESYQNNEDIHARVASEVYGVALDQVSSSQRRSAKAINFGVVYGQSPFGLAKSLDIDKGEAFEFIDAYFKRYPGVDEFMDRTLFECQRDGNVSTILGRRRAIDGVRSPEKRDRLKRQLTMPERTAVNTVIQGSAADIIKLAMLRVHDRLIKEEAPAKLLLQIHDELVFETPPEYLEELAQLVRTEMESARNLAVPLVVDVKSGDNWAQCEPM
ncbi:DNA polymerase I [Blastopirellula retiformator]|uniref:DNA polymerase I n=1 Tax=Blastopirellula retiformator TaxID=2527970 RepID=A0A5C5V030_9BACT|nr:DNA polymerase I [Blastopirellula retiformator]TWT31996.1 DNA polymerase I [Blastopirellula retiformator]